MFSLEQKGVAVLQMSIKLYVLESKFLDKMTS